MLTPNIIINLAPTGMVPSKNDNPFLPLSVDEIVRDAGLCIAEGASIIHIHARDPAGVATADAELFADIIRNIRYTCPDIVITVTTSGRLWHEFEKRSAVLDLEGDAKPDMASLTLGSLNFSGSASINSPDMIERLASKMQERGIKPELEVFDLGMVNYAKVLIKKGLLSPPYYFNILLGNMASAQASLLHVAAIVNDLPEGSVWCLAGIGAAQLPMNTLGLAMGYGVRVGLEDNLWLDAARTRTATNLELVERVATLAKFLGRPPATPAQTRQYLGLSPIVQTISL
ncbi:MAG TPA: 3-keto-5-aminohexanoate cleavage protein [Methylobacter sp.]